MALSNKEIAYQKKILNELISLKKRRELRIMKKIHEKQDEISNCKKEIVNIVIEIKEIIKQSKDAYNIQFFSETKLLEKNLYSTYFKYYRGIMEKKSLIKSIEDNISKLELDKQNLHIDLNKNRAGQEKLKLVLEKKYAY